MNVNIYYGGRGLIDDPTMGVINRVTEVLKELRVNVTLYKLFDMKNTITTLPKTLNDADAIILAASVEWYGVGGYLMQFLDSCWLYGNKDKMAGLCMFPIVISRTIGEREASVSLCTAWELLGGKSCNGICAYVEEPTSFELNADYKEMIEKKAEEIYRTVSQKIKQFPSSNIAIKRSVAVETINFTSEENEMLAKHASDETYIKKQKKDIEDLAGMFKELLEEEDKGGIDRYISIFTSKFKPISGFSSSYSVQIVDKGKTLLINIQNNHIDCKFGQNEEAEIVCKLDNATLDKIVQGHQTFQGAFLSGSMTARGNFKNIRMMDSCFSFQE